MGSRRVATCRCRSPTWCSAVLALVISFAILIFAWRKPRFHYVGGRRLPGLTVVLDHPIVQIIARLLVLATYAWAGLALMAGQDLLTNPIFGFVFVWMWVGLVPISLLLGQFWRATNPLRTIHRGLCAWRGWIRHRVWSACQRELVSGRPRSACSASAGLSWCSRTEPRCRCCGSGRWRGW
jgi:hypothetical protein